MKALCWHGANDIRCDSVPDPRIEDGRDVILKVTSCAICGSDLHLMDGLMPKGSPMDAATDLRAAFQAAIRDPDCVADYVRITGEKPDIARGEEVEPVLASLRRVDPAIKQVLKDSIAE